MGTGALDRYLEAREALIASAVPGTRAARKLADLTDEAVSALAGAASASAAAPYALFALGGYGARRLLPRSDIDLLVISSGTGADLTPLMRGVLYPLWDAGFTVGHQVRSPKAHLRALTNEIQDLTSFLAARQIAGDAALGARTLAGAFKRLRKDALCARQEIARRPRPGSPYLLEPDLKGGAGGQRDIDELVWYAALGTGAPARDCAGLLSASLLEPAGHDRLEAAQNLLTAARWRLHAHAGRKRDTLSIEDADEAGIDADALQRALQDVAHTLGTVRRRLGGLEPDDLAPLTLKDLREAAETGPEALAGLERAAWLGRLDFAVPGFADLMTLRRPALTHRYTVGAHCLRTLTLLSRPATGVSPVRLTRAVIEPLAIAALTHDAGKREPGTGHAERGAEIAREAATRLGAGDAVADAAATLVREHLLLSEVATRSDLSDEDVVLAAAVRVGRMPLIRPLFLLTAADSRATGPGVWTPWREALVGDLATRMEAALSPDVGGTGIVTAAEDTRSAARRRAAAAGSSRTILEFLERAPLRYLARHNAEEVLRDARLVQSLRGPASFGEFAYSTRPTPAGDAWLLDVVVRDRPGLFAVLAGTITLSGLDVLTAEAFTERTGIALDTFVVTSATRAAVTETNWHAFERNLEDVLSGHADLDGRLDQRRRYYDRARRANTGRVSVQTSVHVGPRGAFSTTVHVRALDRVALLYDLARAIDRAGLDIRRAMVTTSARVADDVFEVTGADGAPPPVAVLEETLVPLLEAAVRNG